MTLWLLALGPLAAGLLIWRFGAPRRARLGASGLAALGGLGGLAIWAAVTHPSSTLDWGAGVTLSLSVDPLVAAMALLVPAVAAPVVLWAAGHEDEERLPRLVGLLVAFSGAMELIVLAGDLLVLIVGWELVGALSWALIQHERSSEGAARSAAYAFDVSRLGGLGLFAAAGSALAVTGSFDFGALPAVAASSWGPVLAGGVLLAAASKSAQVPFSPWLFRAMDGPTAVSALLHSSTMVAAGAWVLVRLEDPLARVAWFGDAAIALGLVTALAGGLTAAVQPHAKRLLAASTSAHYGLMFAAVGAGSAGAAFAHLVAHASFKALLFLGAGTAMGLAGTSRLADMRVGRALPWAAAASAAGALALAAVPPLGGAWTKEKIVAATGEVSASLAILAIVAGGLSAWYATRFQLLAYGRGKSRGFEGHRPETLEHVALFALAGLSLATSFLWWPEAHARAAEILRISFPTGKSWELAASVAAVAAGIAGAFALLKRGGLETGSRARSALADWMGLPAAIDASVTRPALALAQASGRFDDRVVDAGLDGAARVARVLSRVTAGGWEAMLVGAVRLAARSGLRAADASTAADEAGVDAAVSGFAAGIGRSGRAARATHTGAVPDYYLFIAAGLILLAAIALLGR